MAVTAAYPGFGDIFNDEMIFFPPSHQAKYLEKQ